MDPNLLSTLLGLAPVAGAAANPNLAPAPSPTSTPSPLQPQSAPQQAGAPAPSAPITVTAQGDTWHPHKRTLLGTIADFALAAMGVPLFPFGKHNENQNVHEAMAGYAANPLQAIHRLSEVGGHEFQAQKLKDSYDDGQLKEQDQERRNRLYDLANRKAADQTINAMLYSAANAKDPASVWGPMREQALKYGDSYGIDYSDLIPDTYDPSYRDTLAMGGIPAPKQLAVGEQVRNHDLQHEDRQANTGEMTRHHQVTEGQGAARVGISEQNANTSAYNAETSRKSEEKRANQVPGARGIVTLKDGSQHPYEDLPDGSRVVYDRDGTAYRYVNVRGTFVPTHQKIPPKAAPQPD